MARDDGGRNRQWRIARSDLRHTASRAACEPDFLPERHRAAGYGDLALCAPLAVSFCKRGVTRRAILDGAHRGVRVHVLSLRCRTFLGDAAGEL